MWSMDIGKIVKFIFHNNLFLIRNNYKTERWSKKPNGWKKSLKFKVNPFSYKTKNGIVGYDLEECVHPMYF